MLFMNTCSAISVQLELGRFFVCITVKLHTNGAAFCAKVEPKRVWVKRSGALKFSKRGLLDWWKL